MREQGLDGLPPTVMLDYDELTGEISMVQPGPEEPTPRSSLEMELEPAPEPAAVGVDLGAGAARHAILAADGPAPLADPLADPPADPLADPPIAATLPAGLAVLPDPPVAGSDSGLVLLTHTLPSVSVAVHVLVLEEVGIQSMKTISHAIREYILSFAGAKGAGWCVAGGGSTASLLTQLCVRAEKVRPANYLVELCGLVAGLFGSLKPVLPLLRSFETALLKKTPHSSRAAMLAKLAAARAVKAETNVLGVIALNHAMASELLPDTVVQFILDNPRVVQPLTGRTTLVLAYAAGKVNFYVKIMIVQ